MAKYNDKSDQHDDDFALFRQTVGAVKPMQQDKFTPPKSVKLQEKQRNRTSPTHGAGRINSSQVNASFAFSDIYQAVLPDEGPMRYCREDVSTHLLKQLRRGDFYPELILDLHGLTKETAKLELSALLHTAHKQLIDCIGVVHGIGSGVLKKALPHLLVQHPHVMAFHQAPLEYGGQGALLILVETAELESDPFK